MFPISNGMNYLFIAIAWGVGVWLGYILSRKSHSIIQKKSVKAENEAGKIVAYIMENGQITNNEVEELLGVSDATATRYLNKLEKTGRIVQVGESGRGVYYILS